LFKAAFQKGKVHENNRPDSGPVLTTNYIF